MVVNVFSIHIVDSRLESLYDRATTFQDPGLSVFCGGECSLEEWRPAQNTRILNLVFKPCGKENGVGLHGFIVAVQGEVWF